MAVYFIQAGTDGPVKIGFAEDVDRRLVKMQADNHKSLAILAIIELGSRDLEASLHTRFRQERSAGEWFKPSVELREYIETLPKNGLPPKPRHLRTNTPLGEHAYIIHELGGSTRLARWLGIDPNVPSNWHKRGIPWRWRPRVATLARGRDIELPRGFLHEGAA